jgi:hypothetical protein
VRDFPTLAARPLHWARKFAAGGVAAYDESMARTDGIRPMRWPLWLAAGMLFGLVLGFAFGLAKPRVRK